MAILISQKNAFSTSSSAAALTSYTFNAAAANSNSLNLFFGLSDIKETLNYNGGNLKVADVSTGDVFNITDATTTTTIDIYKSGNSVIVTNNSKIYTFGSVANTEKFTITFGTGAKSIDVLRTGENITYGYTSTGTFTTTPVTTTGANTLDVVAPTATATALYTNTPASSVAVVQSDSIGTAYLVKNTLTVTPSTTNLAALEAANGTSVNSVTIATAATNTNLPTLGLVDGVYNVYTVDIAGNVSAAASAAVTIVTATNGTILNPANTQSTWNDILNGNQGSPSNAVTFDATGGVDTYLISTTAGSNIVINGFTAATDKLIFDIGSYTGGSAAFAATNTTTGYYSVNQSGTDTVLTHNTDGAIQSITLAGIWDSGSAVGGTIDTLAELNTVLAVTGGSVGYDSLYVASGTDFNATFYQAGSVRMYDVSGTGIGTAATTLTANTEAAYVVAAASVAGTNARLEVRDAAGVVVKFANVILGTTGADTSGTSTTLNGTSGDEVIFGFAGADSIVASQGGNDVISAGADNDSVVASGGNDTLFGGAGADTLDGGAGNDEITGDADIDTVIGGDGDDVFNYASAADLFGTATPVDDITGGNGTDAIRFTATGAAFTMTDLTSRIATVEKITTVANTGVISVTLTAASTGGFNTIDLSGDTDATGNNIISSTGATGISTIIGSAGIDAITLGASAPATTITGGAGADTLALTTTNTATIADTDGIAVTAGGVTSSATFTTALAATTYTGVAGVDTVTLAGGVSNVATITGAAGADIINLGALHTGGVKVALGALADITSATGANVDVITNFITGVDKIQLLSGATTVGSLKGLTLSTTETLAAMLTPVVDATSVATIGNVYTALASATGLNNSAGHELAASATGAGNLVARVVTYTTGAAAGTYLVINDSTAGFAAADDVVIQLVGTTTFAAGDLIVV